MSTRTEPKKRRSCLGSSCMGGVGCVSFAAGVVLALILLAPRLVSPFVSGQLQKQFGKAFYGTLEVDDLRLAWSAPQKLSGVVLRDPDGGQVGLATVVVPSLLDLFGDGRKRVEIELEAELVADEAGATNLARAFEPRPETKIDSRSPGGRVDEDETGWLEEVDLELVVRARRLSWSDAETRARGEPFQVRDLALLVRLVPGEPQTLELDAVIPGTTPSPLELDVRHAGRLGDLARGDLAGLTLDAQAQGLSVALVDGLASLRGALVEMLGSSVDVAVQLADPFGPEGRVSARIEGAERHLTVEGGMDDGAFRVAEDVPFSAALGVPFELVAELVEPHLPQGASLVPGDRHGAATFDAHRLIVPQASLDAFRAGDWIEGVRGVRGHLVLEVPMGVYYTDPTTDASGVILGLSSTHVELRTEEGEPLRGTAYVATDTGAPGDVELSFKLGRPGTTEPDVAYFDLQVRQISSTAVDGYLGLDGCFFEAVGATFGLRVEGDGLTRDGGELMAYVRAQGLSGNVHGHVEDGVLLLDPEHGLNAVFRPAPGWFERCLAREVGDDWSLNLLLSEDEGLRFLTDGTAFPIPETWTKQGFVDALAGAWGKASFRLGTLRFARPATDGRAEQIVGFETIELAAEMSEEGTLDLTLESGLYTGPSTGTGGSFTLQTRVPDVPALLRGGDATGIELDAQASGIAEKLLREVLAPFLPEGATLGIDAEEQVELHWDAGGFRRGADDLLEALSGDATLALGGLRYASGGPDGVTLELADVSATVGLGGTDVDLVVAAALGPGPLARLVGDRVRAELTLFGPGADTGAGALAATLDAPRLTGRAAGRFEGGAFRTGPDQTLSLAWQPTEAGLRELLGASLAPGQSLAPASEAGAPVSLSLADVRVPLGPGEAEAGEAEAGDAAGAPSPLAELRADAELAFPTLLFRDGGPGGPVSITDLRGTLSVRPGERPELALDGLLSGPGAEPAPLRLRARALEPLGQGDEPRAELELRGQAVPTPLVDALGRAGGLLVDVFGPRVDVVATSPALGPRNGTFHLELVSPSASTTVDGELVNGVLTMAEGQGLDASLGLSPLFSERIVGSLLPLVVDVEKPAGAEPCAFRVHDVAFPLDGDLAQLDAVVELDLGDVIYRLLPGIEDSFLDDLTKSRARRIRPVVVRIEQGVAHYDGLPVRIGGEDIGFRGSFGLVDRALSFDAEVPLAALGDRVASKLDRTVGRDVAVPVRIDGTRSRPRLEVSFEGLLQNAAGSLLERWLRGR